jgi:hypothetical protein
MEANPNNPPPATSVDPTLEFTIENFNALVAANTSMETEISNMNVLVADLRDRIADLRQSAANAEQGFSTLAKELSEVKALAVERRYDRDYERDRATALQRKLDRSLGYIDRIVDQDQTVVDEEGKPQFPQNIGPDLSGVVEPVRHGPRTDGAAWASAMDLSPGLAASLRSAEYPSRRY